MPDKHSLGLCTKLLRGPSVVRPPASHSPGIERRSLSRWFVAFFSLGVLQGLGGQGERRANKVAKIPHGNAGQDEEEPEVSPEDEEELEGTPAQHGLPQVQGSVHQHRAELDKHHPQEGPGHHLLRQQLGQVSGRVFLREPERRLRKRPAG